MLAGSGLTCTQYLSDDMRYNYLKIFYPSILKLLLSFSFFSVAALQADELMNPEDQLTFLQNISSQQTDIKNFTVQFEQQRHLSIMYEPLVSKGTCYFEKPDKMRWEISHPYSSILIYNSDRVAKFEIENGKVKKLNFGAADIMRKVLQQIISWMQGDFGEANGLYSIEVFKGRVNKIVLVPKSEAMRVNLQKIELHVRSGDFQMDKVVIRESETDYIQIEFRHKQDNTVLPAKLFDPASPVNLH